MLNYNKYVEDAKYYINHKHIDRCDVVKNETKLGDEKWLELYYMLIMYSFDYVRNHPIDNGVHSYILTADLTTGEYNQYLNDIENTELTIPDSDIENYMLNNYPGVENVEIIDSYEQLGEDLYFIISEFIRRDRESIPNKLHKFHFNITNFSQSIVNNINTQEIESTLMLYDINNNTEVCIL